MEASLVVEALGNCPVCLPLNPALIGSKLPEIYLPPNFWVKMG